MFVPSQIIAQPTIPNPVILKNETITGNLILTNQEIRRIEHTHLKVQGKIVVQDSSQLIIRQSIIELDDPKNFGGVGSGTIEVIHWGQLRADTTIFGAATIGDVDPAQAESLKSGDIVGAQNSQIWLNHCFSQTQGFFGYSTAVIKNSVLIQEPLGLIHVEEQSNVTLEDCEIGAIFLDMPHTIEYNIDSLVPGYHEYWSAHESISDQLPYQLVMRRCILNDNDIGFQGGMEMGWNLTFDAIHSRATVANSKLNKIIFGFPKGEPAIVEGLKIQEPIDFTLHNVEITNTNVQTQWGIFVEEAPAVLTDCEGLFIFMTGGAEPIRVINSEVYEIDPRRYHGEMIFENSIFGGGYEVFDSSHITLLGTMRAMRPLTILDPTSKITRVHQIKVLHDQDGSPFPSFPIRILKDSVEIWQGVPDSSGIAEIEITYDLTNYQDDWVLESLEPIVSLRKAFGIDASNPLTINLRKTEADTVFHPVMHVQRGANFFPDGSHLRPYPTIQEAIDNAFGESILVPPGIFPGTKHPGSQQTGITLSDHVHLLGAGPDSTILVGMAGGEEIEQGQITGFEIQHGFHFINSDLTIRNCLVAHNKDHALVGANCNLNIYNNTLVSNLGDAIFLTGGGNADIRNNIFTNNQGFGIEAHAGTLVQADYNNVWSNGDNYLHADHIGEHDLSVDPLFVDTSSGDYRLLLGSPCIDAGDPMSIFNDIDETRNDLGALGGPYGGITTSVDGYQDTEVGTITMIPNPLTHQARIDYLIPVTGWVDLGLYDLSGKKLQIVIQGVIRSGQHTITWNNDLGLRGVYFLTLQTTSGVVTKKMVVL